MSFSDLIKTTFTHPPTLSACTLRIHLNIPEVHHSIETPQTSFIVLPFGYSTVSSIEKSFIIFGFAHSCPSSALFVYHRFLRVLNLLYVFSFMKWMYLYSSAHFPFLSGVYLRVSASTLESSNLDEYMY